MTIEYQRETTLDAREVIEVYIDSGLGERRPVEDVDRMAAMVRHADLVVTARSDGLLIGLARSITDWSYVSYLSDLAVPPCDGTSRGRV